MSESVPISIHTLAELFAYRCEQVGGGLAYAYLKDTAAIDRQLTWIELADEVNVLAKALGGRAEPGTRALLMYPPGLEVVVAFWACIQAGLVPVPAPAPDPIRRKHSLSRLQAILHDAQAALVLTTSGIQALCAEQSFVATDRQVQWLATDQPAGEAWPSLERRSPISDLAYLQYTSGSTATPRGVMISHRNVLAQCEAIRQIAGVNAESRSLCWLPYFHDYGLVHGILAPFYAGIPAFLLSPLTFLRRPLRWLEAIDRWDITHSGAPSFAYDACVKAYQKQPGWSGDLARWAVASCGAEPIHHRTINAFTQVFAPHGFKGNAFMPAYGLAEATLVVSSTSRSELPHMITVDSAALESHRVESRSSGQVGARELVGCGHPLPGSQVIIVEPGSGVECAAGQVGEIWVSSPSVALGYWRRDEATSEAFNAQVSGRPAEHFLRTGDLGFFSDGQIVITGRLKDLIILNGRNIYPQDLEAAVDGCHPMVRTGGCVAFSVEVDEVERLIMVLEVDRQQDLRADEVATAVRVILAERFEVPVWGIVLVRHGTTPKTSSGKVQRQACRKAYLENSLAVLSLQMLSTEEAVAGSESRSDGSQNVRDLLKSRDGLEEYVMRVFAEQSGLPVSRIKVGMPLVNIGLDSLGTSLVKNRLEQEFGVDLSFGQLFGQGTVRDLAAYLLTSLPESSSRIGASSRGLADEPRSDESGLLAESGDVGQYPLSSSQERLWFLEQVQPGSALNHISIGMRLSGRLDLPVFSASIQGLVQRHDILKMGFASVGELPYQANSTEAVAKITWASLCDIPPSNREMEIRRRIREEVLVPFDLGNPPLLRVLLLETGDGEHRCVLTVHRLVSDGWSLRLLCRELTEQYGAHVNGHGTVSSRSERSYLEFSQWQRNQSESERYVTQLGYWQRQLDHLPSVLDLPSDRPRPRVPLFQGGSRIRVLPGPMVADLEAFCSRQGATKFMAVYSALSAWLQRATRTADIVIGTVVANRRQARWQGVVGYCANTVALRMDLSAVETGAQLLRLARQTVCDAYDHQDVPFERVIGSLKGRRAADSPHVFNVMMVWEDDPLSELRLDGLSVRHIPIDDVAVELDLTLLVVNGVDGLELVMLYDRALFDGETVDRMLAQIEIILKGLIENPDSRLLDLPLLTHDEREQLLIEWNRGTVDVQQTTSIMPMIEACLKQAPERAAAVCGEETLSYRELVERVDRLARAVHDATGGSNARVGLCVDRSLSSLIGILGILKAGAAYVPLDASAPEQRQRLILKDAGVALLVTQRHLRATLPYGGGPVIELESLAGEGPYHGGQVAWPRQELDHAAYVIYTSGSTGRPKGVEITQGALLHSLLARLQYYKDPVERCLLTFPIAFDGSVTSIFWTLLHAGTLVIPTEDHYRDPEQLGALISRHQVSHIVLVPSLYEAMLRDVAIPSLRSLRVVVSAGESLPVSLVRRHYERLQEAALYNEYGPTEATVWSSVYRTTGTESGGRIPIGKPIAGAAIYLLDEGLSPVPVGVVGEIVIGGGSLARGYLNLPELTSIKFIANPFVPESRLYKTGDLGLIRQDGNIEYVGRADSQVKVRGYRIELGEIESALSGLPGVRAAAVVVRDDMTTGPSLIAFVTSDQAPGSASPYLHELLKRTLPSYMVPAAVFAIDGLPYLSNGKVDRQALQQYTLGGNRSETASVRARDPIEQGLLDIWRDVLGERTIDIHQNFFAMGGHSLLATQVISRIREVFRVELPLRSMFESPTIAGVAELIRVEQHRGNAPSPLPPIVPVSREGALPLSFSQQRMWFVQQLAPEATAYNLLFVSRHKGAMSVPVVRQVVNLLAQRHEAFRTTFAMTGAGLEQRIAPWEAPHLVEIDLRRIPTDQREGEARRIAEQEGARPFDLEKGPLARISLITLDQEDHLIVLNLHHIVGDQWSFGILGRDFSAYYNALCQGQPLPEMTLPIQYADYAVWQRRCMTEAVLAAQEQYWTNTLEQLPILHLPTDFPRPAVQTFEGGLCAVDIPDSVIQRLKQFSADQHVTPFMTLLACFQLLLSRYTGQVDLAVGCPIANRTHMLMEQLIGTFVNTLALRVDVSGNPTFAGLLERMKHAALGAFANQDYPFDKLVESLQIERDASMAPLVQVLFNMANAPISDIQLYGLEWAPFEVEPGSAQFDLSLSIELEVAKKAYFTFNSALFMRETIERFAGHYLALIESAMTNPQARVSDLKMLGEIERSRILYEWNRTAAEYPHTDCLPEHIEGRAEETPDAVAVSMDNRALTYRELNGMANQLARALRGMGVSPGVAVGVCLERSVDMVPVLLAVMKAGGCYVPLDPDYPRDRVRFMVEDSGAPLVITTTALSDRFSGQSCRVWCFDREGHVFSEGDEHNLPPLATGQDLAYILYTSGSTGQPKGVEIQHRSLMNFLWSMKRQPGCTRSDTVLSVTTLSFDIAGLELYLPLLVGGRVEIVSRAVATDGHKLRDTLARVQPTIMQATPATWRLLLEAGWAGSFSLTALCGGEALPQDLAVALRDRTKALWNMYGPTETTIWSTLDRISQDSSEITIGRPIANTDVYVLDPYLQPVPVGVAGEIYIGGDGVARGYHGRLDLTADRFIPHPFSLHPDARLYRTGDLGRYRPDGKIVHLGRIDHQVKIRGFRIELGEIEATLSRHAKIKQTVVTARDDQHGMKQLAAYLVLQEGQEAGAEELRSFLRAVLPEYMVPSFFVFLDAFPLTANKKIDVRALPQPELSGHIAGQPYVGPRNGMEVQLTALWQQVLGIQEIGIHDNFFDLGGHSLKAAQLFYQLELVFEKQLPLATLFQAPTIAELAAVLTKASWVPPWQSLVAIQPSGTGLPLFMVPGVGGNVLVFAKLARILGTEQPLYGLQARGLDGKEAPFTSVPEMASHYVQEVRRMHPDGPYLIGGVCTGGLIGYEMARQLIALGCQVTLFMMDTWHPDSYRRYRHRLLAKASMSMIVLGKIVGDIRSLSRLPMNEWWANIARKTHVALSLFSQSLTDHIQDRDFQVQRLTEATLLAVARYRVQPIAARVVNVVASNRHVDDVIPDTRHRWQELGTESSCTVHIPAEDSGRLFVSPFVEDLAGHLQSHLQKGLDRAAEVGMPARNNQSA
ncbi:non-ribosomal peptide synthetase [Nitrospira lenta]|uniref:Putative Multi-domain non-ribosomal peptide synthetase n=1 Tax=Nitrospira lenta TaxID=1436998 RepID=A0A330L6J7_9BACT|nr:non-ribosomal peptide synthetase [Nitrospira lenta]SPP65499.1 putative Multi-domain non-ribosomal peptide synthetase [Nitrospira lenta]